MGLIDFSISWSETRKTDHIRLDFGRCRSLGVENQTHETYIERKRSWINPVFVLSVQVSKCSEAAMLDHPAAAIGAHSK